MKHEFEDGGHNWEFSRWRIPPEGHKLPHPTKSISRIPAEAMFVNEEGWEMGLSPENPLVQSKTIYQAGNSRRAERRRRGGGRHR